MKGVKSVCSFTKSVFSKSSSTPPKRVFSAQSDQNQQPPTSDDDIDDLVGPFVYPSNLGPRGNAFKKKTEEEDDDGSEKSQDEEDGTDDIPTEKHGGIYAYGPGFYQHVGPFRGTPVRLPKYPSFDYASGSAPVREGKGPFGDRNEHQGQCSWCGCSGCKGCPGCGRCGGNHG